MLFIISTFGSRYASCRQFYVSLLNYFCQVRLTRFLDYTYLTNYIGPMSQSEEFLNCEMVANQKSIFPSPIAFIMTKNSSLAPIFNFHLKAIQEKGIYDKLAFYYKTKEPGKITLCLTNIRKKGDAY